MNEHMPTNIEVHASFSRHLGPRYERAGVSLQFHPNQGVGIACKVPGAEPSYEQAVVKGIEDGLSARYGSAPMRCAIWITKMEQHPTDSSELAFYLAARGAIDLAHAVTNPTPDFR